MNRATPWEGLQIWPTLKQWDEGKWGERERHREGESQARGVWWGWTEKGLGFAVTHTLIPNVMTTPVSDMPFPRRPGSHSCAFLPWVSFPSCNLAPGPSLHPPPFPWAPYLSSSVSSLHSLPLLWPSSMFESFCLPPLSLSLLTFTSSTPPNSFISLCFSFFFASFLTHAFQNVVLSLPPLPSHPIYSIFKQTQTLHKLCPRGGLAALGLGKVEKYTTLWILLKCKGVLWEDMPTFFCLLSLFKLMLSILVSGILWTTCYPKPKGNWEPISFCWPYSPTILFPTSCNIQITFSDPGSFKTLYLLLFIET